MSKPDGLDENVRNILDPFVSEFKDAHKRNLLCLAVYGSAVEGDFVAKKSNINLVAIFKKLTFEDFQKSLKIVGRGSKKKIVAPLMLTQNLIKTSTDVFPVEYLGMKEQHIVVFGKDLLKGLKIGKQDLRRECEEMIKGTLIRLRSAYLETGGRRKLEDGILGEALTALVPALRSLLYLSHGKFISHKADVIEKSAKEFGLSPRLMNDLMRIRLGEKPARDEDILIEELLDQLLELAHKVDKLGSGRMKSIPKSKKKKARR